MEYLDESEEATKLDTASRVYPACAGQSSPASVAFMTAAKAMAT